MGPVGDLLDSSITGEKFDIHDTVDGRNANQLIGISKISNIDMDFIHPRRINSSSPSNAQLQ